MASLVLLAVLVVVTASQTAQAADPLSGRWQLNLAKSKYEPGPPPKSAVRIQHIDGDTLKVALEIILADGQSGDAHYTARLDGRDYPAGEDADAGTIAWKRIDERTVEYTRKKAGATTETGRLHVSEDGGEMTLSARGRNAAGLEFDHLVVFDRWP